MIPDKIKFSDIIFGDRARKQYDNIEALAESIELRGTETPIVLSLLPDGKYLLEAGGRRYTAMQQLGVEELYYGSVSVPGKPGFVLKTRIADEEDHLLTELIENLHRENMDWREELQLIVKAFKVKKRELDLKGEKLYLGTFGKMLGNYGYADIQAALAIHDDVIADPEYYANCPSLLAAYKMNLKKSEKKLTEALASRVFIATPATPLEEIVEKESEGNVVIKPTQIPFSTHFKNCNSLDWMDSMEPNKFDHIICDPDFAVSEEQLSSNSASAKDGIIQNSIEESLSDLYRLMPLAFKVTKKFFIFFYDLDHHEKLQSAAKAAGFAVQRWPLIWHKLDHRSNAAAQYNFTKNIEYAMVCRKPGATLPRVCSSSIIPAANGMTAKIFNHPFAKPVLLWHSIFSAVTHPGETVYDPFMGSGSSSVSAVKFGLSPYGSELSSDHFNNAILNIKKAYQEKSAGEVEFI